tara:strand:+ start:413 stop:550 length:138 start_codon:yes stop_codon:yes gene_type:complete
MNFTSGINEFKDQLKQVYPNRTKVTNQIKKKAVPTDHTISQSLEI